MKKLKLFGLLLTLPFVSGCYNSYGGHIYPDADKYLVGNQVYAGTVNVIDLEWASGVATLISDDTIEGVKIVEENNLPDAEKVHTYFNQGTLFVKFLQSGYRANNLNPKDKEVIITYNPKDISKYDLSLTSGKLVSTASLKATEKVEISLTSGEAILAGIDTELTDISITSGSIKVDAVKAKTIDVSGTSGSIDLKNIEVESLDSSFTSGSVNYEFKSFKNADIGFTSGSERIKLPEDGGTLTIDKTSGKVNASREHTVNGNKYVFGTSESKMAIDFTSGTLTIE